MDRDGDDLITDGSEMFGDSTPQVPPPHSGRNGFAALQMLDANLDGAVDADDPAFASLRLWQDRNHDGVSQADELSPLPALGVAGLSVLYTEQPVFPPIVMTHLVKLACELPDDVARSLSTWTCAELAKTLIRDQIVDSISPSSVQRILAAQKLKPWRVHHWLSSDVPRDEVFRQAVRNICTLYTRQLGTHERVLCIDEKTSLQPRTRTTASLPARAPNEPEFLDRYPTPQSGNALGERRMATFLAEHAYSGHRTAAELLERLGAAPRSTAGELEAKAKGACVRALVTVLRSLVAQLATLNAAIEDAVEAHPDAAIFTPLFRKGRICVAKLLAELGDDRARFVSVEHLTAEGGAAPVTFASGKNTRGVAFRWACNTRLRQALVTLADTTRQTNPWARAIYQGARNRGKQHAHATRILARAWCRVLWTCWQKREPYDPAKHRAAREFTLPLADQEAA